MGILFDVGTKTYRRLFAKPFFYKWNRWVFLCGLKALGINNFSDQFAGEYYFLKKLIKSKDKPLLIDVGANVGNWSRQALQINPQSLVYAFEPNPKSYETLSTIPHIKTFNVAVGAEAKQAKIYHRNDQPTWPLASLNRAAIERLTSDINEVDIKVVVLDEFIEKENIKNVTLLKIDVEGYEYEVLQGSQRAINTGIINTIQFEFNDMNIYTRRFFRDFQELLPDFVFYRLLPKGMIPLRNYDSYLKEIFAFQNIVAIRKADVK